MRWCDQSTPWDNLHKLSHILHYCYHWTFAKGGARTCFVDSLDSHTSVIKYMWARPLMEFQRYGASNVVMWPWNNLHELSHIFHYCYHWTSVKDRAHTCFVDSLDSHTSTKYMWALPLMEVQRYGASNVVMWKVSNRIIFNFYMRLSLCWWNGNRQILTILCWWNVLVDVTVSLHCYVEQVCVAL